MARRWLETLEVLARWTVAAALGSTITFAVERVRIVANGQSELRWAAEAALWGGHVLLADMVVAIGLVACGLVRALPSRVRGSDRRRTLLSALLVFGALFLPLRWVGETLASGAWISEQSFAPLVVWAPLVAGAVASPLAVYLACSPAASPRHDRRWLVVLVLGMAALVLADHLVSPGLYSEFHMVLQVLTTTAAVVAIGRVLARRPPLVGSMRGRILAAVCTVAVALGPIAWFEMTVYARAALVLRSPVARDWIRNAMPQKPWAPLYYVLADLDVHAGRYTLEEPSTDTTSLHRDPRWNVILVVADTMRADAVPPARPEDGTAFAMPGDTPRFEAWMKGAQTFRVAYSAATETKRAMPPMFRSIEANDDPITQGVPLGRRLEALGLSPLAVVHRYFMPAKYAPVAALLEGFDEVRVYENPDTNTAIPQALELAAAHKDEQFVMFVHLYTLHLPGYAGKVLGGGSRAGNYRKALKYLDTQFGELLDGIDGLGLRDRTLIVFVADHGEGLDDHGVMLHGPTAFDEDVRVPLAFEIPGLPGRIIEETVGTIDLAPTLVDLLGAPAEPGDRGRSLVPLFMEEPQQPKRPYYFENNKGSTVGVVIGRDKLIYEKGVDVALRFDVDADPDEHQDLHDPTSDIDRTLLQTLVQFQPKVASEELKDEATLDLLREHLKELDPKEPGSALPLLVRLVGLKLQKDLVRRCGEIFDEADDPAVRLLLLRHLLERAPKTMTPRVVAWFEEIAGLPLELEVADALARQGQKAFAPDRIAGRMAHYAENGGPETWEPWLRLVRTWDKSAADFAPPLATMLSRSRTADVPLPVMELMLQQATSLTGEDPAQAQIAEYALALAAHDEPRVRAAAIRALGAVGATQAQELVKARVLAKDEDIRVRREAAAALTALIGDDALPALDEASRAVAMTTLVVRHLRDRGTPAAIPLLQRIAKDDKNGDTRIEARKAVEQIEKRGQEK